MDLQKIDFFSLYYQITFIHYPHDRCRGNQLQLQEGDYSDLITYLSGLFGIKKIPAIEIENFRISYSSALILRSAAPGDEYIINRYPEKDERERMKSISLKVLGLSESGEITVTINWESVDFTPDPQRGMAETFIDVLDRSTFRYF